MTDHQEILINKLTYLAGAGGGVVTYASKVYKDHDLIHWTHVLESVIIGASIGLIIKGVVWVLEKLFKTKK